MTRPLRIRGEQVQDRGTINLDEHDIRLADGTRLTEARADELAAEILERTGRGRPSLSRPGVRSPQLRLSVPDDLPVPPGPAGRGRASQHLQPGPRRPRALPSLLVIVQYPRGTRTHCWLFS